VSRVAAYDPAMLPAAPDLDTLASERARLWEFGRRSVHPAGGFAWLDDTGQPVLDRPVEAWVTCRMTHVAALEVLAGHDDARRELDHGVAALRTTLYDAEHGGWFAAVDAAAGVPATPEKRCYEHAFVLLAAASATAAGHPDGPALLADAAGVFEERFWRENEGMAAESWDRAWTTLEDYRGANANMHSVEAMLAVHDVTGEAVWLERAERVLHRVVHEVARPAEWRLPEHFTSTWVPVPDYNRDSPADPFRPYGVTIGHLLEWSRLALHVRAAHLVRGEDVPDWLLEDAQGLFEAAVRDGWHVDGEDGFVYTTDFDGTPVVRTRLHWVLAEGIAAAWALAEATGEQGYLDWYAVWWDQAERRFIDRVDGSWRHELDEHHQPSTTVWNGKPDVYHAYQAALLPALRPAGSFVGSFAGPPR